MENQVSQQFVVEGGRRLNGELHIKAAKNAVLPIIAASILSSEDIIIQNVPDLLDIRNMLVIMQSLGCKAEFKNGNIYLNCRDAKASLVTADLTRALRSSIFMLGPILSRFGEVELGLPGGCAIGKRPIDIHIDGLRALGVKVEEKECSIVCKKRKSIEGEFRLKFPSVGATENLIMAGVLSNGTTIIYNAAKEPEVVDLSNFINALGGRITGAGTNTVVIKGVKKLYGAIYSPSADRIAAPTYLAAGAITRGCVTMRGISCATIGSCLNAFEAIGCSIICGRDFVTLKLNRRPKTISKLITTPHPGFPTDMQPQIGAILSLAKGTSIITETIFENRFRYALELQKFGALTNVATQSTEICGVKQLKPAEVVAEDLRGGAALTIAALATNGKSIIKDIHHIDRGYEKFEEGLRSLGASIVRI
ncbi:MAG: UDP-N-acetylglucosamine 1-carboxyvinyltransferase [Firmicutes bacterium]|nr:UDP-N-acetylglucosamine 1-carboxyvinyltransferase [Bacillota bacterium]